VAVQTKPQALHHQDDTLLNLLSHVLLKKAIPYYYRAWPITTWTEQVHKWRLGFHLLSREALDKGWKEEVNCASDTGFCFYSADMIPRGGNWSFMAGKSDAF
jgi:hypothetical protein